MIKKDKTKKPKVIHVGIRKNTTLFFWLLLIFSVSFGIYKNFTAIDRQTIHEQKVIETKIVDTNLINSFVSNFAEEYYTWSPKKEQLETRTNNLKNYLTEELSSLNTDMIRSDIPTTSTVEKVQIWTVDKIDAENYHVLFSVSQSISETKDGKATNKTVNSAFKTTLHVDNKNNLVITQNPTMSSFPTKSAFEPKPLETDGSVEATEIDDIQKFLTTFFKIYPTAKESELVYYVKDSSIRSVGKNYVFAELINPIVTRKNKKLTVHLAVKYLDQDTKATQISQFDLVVEKKDGNWMIETKF